MLYLAKDVAAMFFPPHPYIVAPNGATDIIMDSRMDWKPIQNYHTDVVLGMLWIMQ